MSAATSLSVSYWPADTSEPLLESTVGGALREAAEELPDAAGLVTGTPDHATRRRWTYAEMLERAERTARALLGRFQPGERIAVWAPNIPEWLELQFGAALAGMTLVTINPAYRPKELAYVLGQSRSSGLFLVPEFRGTPMAAFAEQVRCQLPELREIISFRDWERFLASGSPVQQLPPVHPGDPSQIQYTSGTTGFPKGAVLHHRGITNNSRFIALRYEVEPGERWLNFMPLFHVAGCTISALGALQRRATQVLAMFEPALALDLIESERCSLFIAAPTMFQMLLDHPDFGQRDLSSLRTVGAGGMMVPARLVRRIESTLGIPLGIMFGQTEACGIATQVHLGCDPDDRAESVGKAHPHTDVKIVDLGSGEIVPTGIVGEICVRGYLVMSGYFEQPELTATAIDTAGWLHTGDLGSMDDRGFVRVEGRVKEIINRGAEKFSPYEIEQLLRTHPSVADAAVVGVPDDTWGEVVAAFVRPSPGCSPTEEELFAFCRAQLAPYKTPKQWVFVDQFPMTPSGKVQKFILRDQLASKKIAAARENT